MDISNEHRKSLSPPETRTLAVYDASAELLAESYERADRARMQRVMRSLVARGRKVVEIGCGSGADAAALHAMGADIFAIDGSQAMLAEAARRHPEIRDKLIHLELPNRLPFPDGTFDVAIASTVLMHFTPEKLDAVVAEIARVLRPGCCFYVTVIPARGDLRADSFDGQGRFFNQLDMRALAETFERHLLYPDYWNEVPDGLGRGDVRVEEGMFRRSASPLLKPENAIPIGWNQVAPTGVLPRIAREFPPFDVEVLNPERSERLIDRAPVTPTLDALLFPTLGCFTPGYSLVVPSRPVYSFGELTEGELTALGGPLQRWREIMGTVFGDTIIAEHGSSGQCTETAACIAQAHLHLVPMAGLVDELKGRYLNAGGRPDEELRSLAELPRVVQDRPYILLSPDPETYLIWFDVAHFPRQFVRRQCADLLGLGNFYNWRVFPFVEQMELTSGLLRPLFLKMAFEMGSRVSPTLCWETVYDLPDAEDWRLNPHIALFGERDIERLLFFSGCQAQGIAEEALDQLGDISESSDIDEPLRRRIYSASRRVVERAFSVTAGGAALRVLKILGVSEGELARMREELIATGGDDDDA